MTAMDHLFANVKWKCCACGADSGTCDCWVKCECGHSYQRGKECNNKVWHVARQFAEETADLIVKDMAESYRLFQREHMAARLKRAVIRQTHQFFVSVFDGVEAARRGRDNQQTTPPVGTPCRLTPCQYPSCACHDND